MWPSYTILHSIICLTYDKIKKNLENLVALFGSFLITFVKCDAVIKILN